MSRNSMVSLTILLASVALTATVSGQEFNIDFGNVDNAPGNTYGAVAGAGFWNSFPGLHGTTTNNLVAIDGQTTSVSLTQIGGFENLTADDPAVSGDDAALLEDYLVTFDDGLESCVFFDNMEPGDYEVWIYAWMPSAPDVEGYTSVDHLGDWELKRRGVTTSTVLLSPQVHS